MDAWTIIGPALGTLGMIVLVIVVVGVIGGVEYRGRVKEAERAGVWLGADEPPPGFRGVWDNGRVVQRWPLDIVVIDRTAWELHEIEED